MIIIKEQYGYKNPKSIEYDLSAYTTIEPHKKLFKQKKSNGFCYEVTKNEKELNIEASYFVGVDWFIENKLPIYIQPKLNKDKSEVNYVRMLFDALQEPENFNHLDYLCEINFDKPSIKIDQTQDLLSPLLVIQYLQLLKRIVQKGLKKSYYPVVKNLNVRVKGKILVNATIKNNHTKSKMLYSYCKYDEFGVNTIENKVLKKALLFSQKAIQNINGINPEQLQGLFNYIQPAFHSVYDEVEIEELKTIKPNPLYKEYKQALKLAKFILKRYGYTISTLHPVEIETPPFWIDMSKLFELYVFAKLKELFPLNGEVEYHIKTNRQELDFIINSKDKKYQMVVDAKYKPQYKDGNISKEDIRQVSGYARMKSIYNELEMEDKYNEVIDCLIIYSDQKSKRKDFVKDNFEYVPEYNYVKFFKIGIELPIVKTTENI
ncbi:McrC family protein [Flavobacterium sp. NKUCC04_CG]|uniref:McrC family protein n=1 Tax=Flavobacterium sp. NKUCC04_CG TaxID=2842121 RepID=UPI001C5B9669|nr:McrC family protein [Flavobacterium sp. NKUCC04_CG]MBW3518063.1 McrC family protein [Flavobacterium sp. NKUCC04_CG]